jgi:hypothetical protein
VKKRARSVLTALGAIAAQAAHSKRDLLSAAGRSTILRPAVNGPQIHRLYDYDELLSS